MYFSIFAATGGMACAGEADYDELKGNIDSYLDVGEFSI